MPKIWVSKTKWQDTYEQPIAFGSRVKYFRDHVPEYQGWTRGQIMNDFIQKQKENDEIMKQAQQQNPQNQTEKQNETHE